ncbi:response regulator transcription factor [Azospirillum sp.]|uniref:response regulator transcription factor n=1 Tax=Azospirillum sp. TaxID=34012 RepID=UPI002D68C998|nr:response regulator transcription factor [Azospirillum sp.]HYF89746.1 response regulator transcription factor [Azospirillum sp.]
MIIVTLALIDPCRLFREGIKRLLDGSRFRVVGEGARPDDPINAAAELLLIDPALSDIIDDTFQTLRDAHPNARLVVLTEELDTQRLATALRAGADGYLRKDITSEALMQSLTLVMMGEKVFPTDLAALLISDRSKGMMLRAEHLRKSLSQRESQILRCLLNGNTNKHIAIHLGVTEATVKVHVKSLLRKINVSNRTQAAVWAMNNDIEQRV